MCKHVSESEFVPTVKIKPNTYAPPQIPSQDPKGQVYTKMAVSSMFSHLCFFSCSLLVPFLIKGVESFVSNALQWEVVCVCVSHTYTHTLPLIQCVCLHTVEILQARQRDRDKAKVMLCIVWWTESLGISFPRTKSDQPLIRRDGKPVGEESERSGRGGEERRKSQRRWWWRNYIRKLHLLVCRLSL